jgi:nitric-oxide synthase, bacterial
MKFLLEEATTFLTQFTEENNLGPSYISQRKSEIEIEIEKTGTYTHTFKELEFGAKLAWRNSNKCIGRLYWKSLHVLDCRHIFEIEDARDALFNHLSFGTNAGNIRSVISIFPPKSPDGSIPIKILNEHLIRFAGYLKDTKKIGDQGSLDFTNYCVKLGWKSKETPFDILPLVVQHGSNNPRFFEYPDDKILRVKLSHPNYPTFDQLNLSWYALPVISNMDLNIGGIIYPTAPFNGWYMSTEISARNLIDPFRYDKLIEIAESFNLNTNSNPSIWKDRAIVELNIAILESYKNRQVKIVDHHTAAEQFRKFTEIESHHGRNITGDWTWLITPISPSSNWIFHTTFNSEIKNPNFYYREKLDYPPILD